MRLYKRDEFKRVEEDVKQYLKKDEVILNVFPVIPVDYNVIEYSTPYIFLTSSSIVFTYDTSIEVYELDTLEIYLKGEGPKFNIWSILLEKQIQFTKENIQLLKADEYTTQLSIREPNGIPKEFLLRNGMIAEKSFKTWAMYQILLNQQSGGSPNVILKEMLGGYFSTFNTKTVFMFVILFLAYFVIKIVSFSYFPKVVDNVFDGLFVVVAIWMIYWLYISVNRNLKRFEDVCMSYSQKEL